MLLHDAGRFRHREVVDKLIYKWLGLYQISRAMNPKGTYFLAEVEKHPISGSAAENILKQFYPRQISGVGEFTYF